MSAGSHLLPCKGLKADYVLVYKNTKLAVVEAKAWDEELTAGVGQAKDYASKLAIRFTYSTNGQGVYGIDMGTGEEGELLCFPSPEELWNKTFSEVNKWRDRFSQIPFEDKGGSHQARYYQDIAVNRVIEAVSHDKQRILLTLARIYPLESQKQAQHLCSLQSRQGKKFFNCHVLFDQISKNVS